MSAEFGKDWKDMSHAERAEFINVFNRPHAGLDSAIAKRDGQRNANGDHRIADINNDVSEVEEPAEPFIDSAADFLSIEDPPLENFIPEITPKGAIKTGHGHPRTLKSESATEEFISVATATPAYGLERFTPLRAYNALYCSQEDAAPTVRRRVKGYLKARGITSFPETLNFAIFKGIDFDTAEWRERFFNEVKVGGYEIVFIDPIRSFTAFADAGPKDVIPLAKYFRRFTILGITIQLVHHDTKPPASGPDSRRRSHQASGGGWFSISECPVSYERISEGQSLVSPEDFKFSSDPAPFTITYRNDETGIRLIGEDSTACEAHTLAIDEAVIEYLASNTGASGRTITKALRKGYDAVTDSLDRLLKADKLDCVDLGRGKGKKWFRK